jgi:hypothetical protein
MEAARTSETSVDIQLRTRQYIPEDSELDTRRRENLKSHIQEEAVQMAVHGCVRDTADCELRKRASEVKEGGHAAKDDVTAITSNPVA